MMVVMSGLQALVGDDDEAASAIGARRKAQHGISHACFELRWCIVAVAVPRRR